MSNRTDQGAPGNQGSWDTKLGSGPGTGPADPMYTLITGTITTTDPSVGPTGAPVPAQTTQVGGVDAGGNLQQLELRTADPAGPEAGLVVRNIPSGTQQVSATTMPLPTGAATSALQTTGNSSLTSIDTKTPVLGQASMAASRPVVIASDQSAVPVSGTVTANIGTSGSLATETTLSGVLTTTAFQARINTLGQKTSANSTPVVLSSDQSAVPVSGVVTANIGTTNGLALDTTLTGGTARTRLTDGITQVDVTLANALKVDASTTTALPLPTGAATSALQTTGNTSLGNIDTKLPAQGQATMAASLPVVLASNQSALPVTDNAGSLTVDTPQLPAALVGGRLDVNVGAGSITVAGTSAVNVAQVGGSATAAGAGLTTAGTQRVVLPTDQSAIPVTDNGGSLTVDGTVTANLGTLNGAATSALQTSGNASLTSIDGKTPALGQATMAASSPVVIASNQSAIPVTGTVAVTSGSVIDAGNSTTAPLAGAGAFTGVAVDTLTYEAFRISGIADTNVTVTIQYSPDGVNWDHGQTYTPLAANNAWDFAGAPHARYARVVITNLSGSAQTVLRNQATLLAVGPTGDIATIEEPLIANSMAQTTRSLIVGQSTAFSTQYVNVKVDPSGALTTTATLSGTPNVNLAQVAGTATAAGAGATTAGTQRVVLPTDQSAIPITDNAGSLTVDTPQLPAALVGGRLDVNIGAGSVTVTGTPAVNVAQVGGAVVTTGSGAAAAGTQRVILATDQSVVPINDNGGSLTVDTPQLAATLGQKAMAASAAVVIASDQSAVPVSGTVTANIGTTNGLALDATLTGGTAKAIARGGAKGATTAADATSTAEGVDHQALDVQIYSGGAAINPTQIRALTSADVVTAAQATRANLNANATIQIAGTDASGANPVPISAAALPLPTGAATSALQTTGNTSLGNIDTKTPALGQALMAASVPVAIASNQSAVPVSGTVTANIGTTNGLALDATLTGGTAKSIVRGGAKGATTAADVTSTAEGVDHQALDVQIYSGGSAVSPASSTQLPAALVGGRLDENVGAWLGSTAPTVGQKAMAASLPVVISSDQSAVPVSGSVSITGTPNVAVTSSVLPTGAATETTLGTRLADATFTTRINTLGQKVMAASTPVVISSDQSPIAVAGTITASLANFIFVVDANNTTSTPLNAGLTFTGASRDVLNYASVNIDGITDQVGTLFVEFSQDNANWDHTQTYANLPAGQAFMFSITFDARYFRIRFTNTSVTNQTYLRITSILNPVALAGDVSTIDTPLSTHTNAQATRSLTAGPTTVGGGTFVTATVNASGQQNVNVAASVLPPGAATDATLTGGTAKSIVRGGAKGATTAADVTSTAEGVDHQALDVQLYGSSGNAVAVKAASTAAVAADPAVVVAISPNNSVTLWDGIRQLASNGLMNVSLHDSSDVFNQPVVAQRIPQVQAQFNVEPPNVICTTTVNTTGSVATTNFMGRFSTGTGAAGSAKGVSFASVAYTQHNEVYCAITAQFTAGVASSTQRIGLYDATNGFSWGYNNNVFGIWTRYNGVDTFTAQAAWNIDVLSGAAGSKFTRAGVPEALVQTNINFFRVRFGWLGIAPILFEVLSPDGAFIPVHIVRYPNSQNVLSITNPNLPVTVEVINAGNTTNLNVDIGCWVAGISAPSTPTVHGVGTITALAGSTIIQTTGAGGLSATITGTWAGQIAFEYSVDGNIWAAKNVFDSSSGEFITYTNTNTTISTSLIGYRALRLVASAWQSGTAIITYTTGPSSTVIASPAMATQTSGYSPDPANYNVGDSSTQIDASNRLETHSTVLSDEGAFRDDFVGSSINTSVIGNVTFVNGSTFVSGTGLAVIKAGQYIKLDADAASAWAKVASVTGDGSLTLATAYTGTTATGATSYSNWISNATSGASVSVANSLVTLASGATNGATAYILRAADYGPMTVTGALAISQRVANQTIVFGLVDVWPNPNVGAYLSFTGTNNATLNLISQSSVAAVDIETTAVTFDTGIVTSNTIRYQIDVTNDAVSLAFAEGIAALARNVTHLPAPYTQLQHILAITNTAAASNTTVTSDFLDFDNFNHVDVSVGTQTEPLPVNIVSTTDATYSAAMIAVASAATATDIFTITGSTGKVIDVIEVEISAVQTTASNILIQLVKRSTANTGGGTPTTATNVPHDSRSAAATATVRSYTANPTLGTAVGTMRAQRALVPAAGTATAEIPVEWTFVDGQPVSLRGATEVLAVNLNGVTVTGGSFNCYIVWKER